MDRCRDSRDRMDVKEYRGRELDSKSMGWRLNFY